MIVNLSRVFLGVVVAGGYFRISSWNKNERETSVTVLGSEIDLLADLQ